MDTESEIVSIQLTDGTFVKIEARPIGDQEVSASPLDALPFRQVSTIIKSVANDVAKEIKEIYEKVQPKPKKIGVKIGLEVGIESGQLTALIVKGAGKANFEISIEWSD